jgi:hypothetical protein
MTTTWNFTIPYPNNEIEVDFDEMFEVDFDEPWFVDDEE